MPRLTLKMACMNPRVLMSRRRCKIRPDRLLFRMVRLCPLCWLVQSKVLKCIGFERVSSTGLRLPVLLERGPPASGRGIGQAGFGGIYRGAQWQVSSGGMTGWRGFFVFLHNVYNALR